MQQPSKMSRIERYFSRLNDHIEHRSKKGKIIVAILRVVALIAAFALLMMLMSMFAPRKQNHTATAGNADMEDVVEAKIHIPRSDAEPLPAINPFVNLSESSSSVPLVSPTQQTRRQAVSNRGMVGQIPLPIIPSMRPAVNLTQPVTIPQPTSGSNPIPAAAPPSKPNPAPKEDIEKRIAFLGGDGIHFDEEQRIESHDASDKEAGQ
ncbi:hypothetical protein [uncultured Mitsuokella sp.]|uniref:hypothetical protein n=1 Tax=uncultured Mitsuokella sp. TaxID=453120 RepID=UPI002621B6F3|nr:hypothetical protein [uncultured Mitsuokella sp.]